MTATYKQAIRYVEGHLGIDLAPWQKVVLKNAMLGRPLVMSRRGCTAWLWQIPRRALAGPPKPLIHKGRKP